VKVLVHALFFGALLMAPAAQADEKEAETCLRAKVWEGYSSGWGLRTLTRMSLDAKATKNYLVTLYKGNEYKIITCSDAGTSNLDVALYNMKGEVVLQDKVVGREPSLSFTPSQTETFYVVLQARQVVNPEVKAGVAMAVTYR
jgi:hypothetical protein